MALSTELPEARWTSSSLGTRRYAVPTEAPTFDRASERALRATPGRKRTSTLPGTTVVPGGTRMTPPGKSTESPVETDAGCRAPGTTEGCEPAAAVPRNARQAPIAAVSDT